MEKYLIKFFCLFLFWNNIYYLLSIYSDISNLFFIIGIGMYVLYMLYLFLMYVKSFSKIKVDFIFILFVMMLLYLLSLMDDRISPYAFQGITEFNPANPFYGLWFFSIPAYYLFRNIKNYSELLTQCCIYSKFIVFAYLILYFLSIFYLTVDIQYMSFATNLITPLCFLYYSIKRQNGCNINKHTVFNIIMFYLMLFIVFFIGSRGAFLVILFYYVLLNLRGKDTKRKIFFLLLVGILIALFVINFESIMRMIINVFDNIGIESRNLNLLIENEISNTSGRDVLWTELINNFSFININGLFYDRFLLTDTMDKIFYSHNIFLEILTDFGLCFGILLIMILFYIIINNIIKTKNQLRELFFIFITQGFLLLQTSGSFITCIQFYLIIAVFFSQKELNEKSIKHTNKCECLFQISNQ